MSGEQDNHEPTERETSRNKAYACVRAATDYDLVHNEDGSPTKHVLNDLILNSIQDMDGDYVYSGASWVNLSSGSPVAYLHSCPFDSVGYPGMHESKDPVIKAISTPLMVDDIKKILRVLSDREANKMGEKITTLKCSTNLNFATFLILQLGFKIDEDSYNQPVTKTKFESEYERIQHSLAAVNITQYDSERERLRHIVDQYELEKKTEEVRFAVHLVGSLKDTEDRVAKYEERANQGELLIAALHKISKSVTSEAVAALLDEVKRQGYMLRTEKGLRSSSDDLYISRYPGFTPIGLESKRPLIGWDRTRQKVVFLRPTRNSKNPMALDRVVITGDDVENLYDTFPYCLPIDEMRMDAKGILSAVSGAAKALDKIHSAGLVHGDIKPEHIGLSDDGYALLDFEHTAKVGSERKGSSPGYININRLAEHDMQIIDDMYAYAVTLLKLYCNFGYRIPTSRHSTIRYAQENMAPIRVPTKKAANIRPVKGSYEEMVLENEEMYVWHKETIGRLPGGEMKSFFLKTIVDGDFSEYPNCTSLVADFKKKWPGSVI